jgi:hypothetical protein
MLQGHFMDENFFHKRIHLEISDGEVFAALVMRSALPCFAFAEIFPLLAALLHIFLSCRKSKEATLCFVIFLDNLQAF